MGEGRASVPSASKGHRVHAVRPSHTASAYGAYRRSPTTLSFPIHTRSCHVQLSHSAHAIVHERTDHPALRRTCAIPFARKVVCRSRKHVAASRWIFPVGNSNAQLVVDDTHSNGGYYSPRGCRIPALEDCVLARLLTFGRVLVALGGAYLIETFMPISRLTGTNSHRLCG
jgi:hypothetical protein